MRQHIYFIVLAVMLIPTLVITPSASATVVLSQDQIQAITSSCKAIQSNLQRLQQADRLLRVNLGRSYDSIARRLMAPLNSRIALDGLDGVALAKTTVDFNDQFNLFRQDYSTYDADLSRAMSIDCNKQPVDVYNAITDARTARQAVYNDTQKLSALLATFSQQFDAFAAQQQASQGGAH